MDKKFIIRFYGNANSVAIPMIQAFGNMQFYDPSENLYNFQTLIVECSFEPCIVDFGFCKSLFDAGKTIGLLGITEKELYALAKCTGRKLNLAGKNILVRQLKTIQETDENFSYTILPDYSRAEIIDEYVHNRKSIYHELRDKVFQKETAPPNYHQPPAPVIYLYPISNGYEAIHGSRSTLYNSAITEILYQQFDSCPPTSYINLQVDAYAYLSNGDGGDSNYYLILHSQLTSVFPVSVYYNSVYACMYSYKLGLNLTHPGRNINLQPSGPNQQSQTVSNTYGYNIYLQSNLLKGWPDTILINGRDLNGDPITIPFSPNFASMINQVVFPCVQSYFPKNEDSGTESKVSFTINDTAWNDPSSGNFEMLSNFIVDAEAGERSLVVQLQLSLTYTVWVSPFNNPGFQSAWQNTVQVATLNIDLAQMTKEQPYNPPASLL